MGLSINLRGDLARLSDAELAARLEHAWQAHQAVKDRVPQCNVWYSEDQSGTPGLTASSPLQVLVLQDPSILELAHFFA